MTVRQAGKKRFRPTHAAYALTAPAAIGWAWRRALATNLVSLWAFSARSPLKRAFSAARKGSNGLDGVSGAGGSGAAVCCQRNSEGILSDVPQNGQGMRVWLGAGSTGAPQPGQGNVSGMVMQAGNMGSRLLPRDAHRDRRSSRCSRPKRYRRRV